LSMSKRSTVVVQGKGKWSLIWWDIKMPWIE
jgi:hypothetical protein